MWLHSCGRMLCIQQRSASSSFVALRDSSRNELRPKNLRKFLSLRLTLDPQNHSPFKVYHLKKVYPFRKSVPLQEKCTPSEKVYPFRKSVPLQEKCIPSGKVYPFRKSVPLQEKHIKILPFSKEYVPSFRKSVSPLQEKCIPPSGKV